MRKCLSLASILLLAASCLASEPSPQARARAALALLQKPAVEKNEDCGCGGIDLPCKCGDSCACTACKTHQVAAKKAKAPINPIENLTYEIAYQRAVRNNQPLLIWVGETCPACESSWTSYIHCRCTSYDSPSGVYNGPGVIIGKPDGMGGMDRVGTLSGIPTLTAVQALLGENKPLSRAVVQQAAPVAYPTYLPAAPICIGGSCGFGSCGSMGCGAPIGVFGGFGGGGFRSGCAGGCCGGGCR